MPGPGIVARTSALGHRLLEPGSRELTVLLRADSGEATLRMKAGGQLRCGADAALGNLAAHDTEAQTIETGKDALVDDVEQRLAVDQTSERVLTIRSTIT